MKNAAFKNSADLGDAALSAPMAVPVSLPKTVAQLANETDRRMLLIRLSDAAARIREETELIQRTSFTDSAGRLLRILGEAVEEQRLSFGPHGNQK